MMSVYVGNLSFEATEEERKRAIVEVCWIVESMEEGGSKGVEL